MANRTVSVEFKAKVTEYIGPVKEAASATEGLDDKVQKTDRDIKKIPPDAAKAAAALKAMGVESGRTALQLEDVDAKTGKAGTSMKLLEQRLADARGEVKRLADEFNRTGNADSLTKLFGAQDRAKDLEKLKTDLSKALDDGGRQGGRSFLSKFESMISSDAGIGEALWYAVASAAPLIGGAIDAAVLLGVGSGGLATGIIAQLHDPQVQAATQNLGATLKGALISDTSSFKLPLIVALNELGAALANLLNKVDFKSLSTAIEPLANGLTGLIDNLGPGLNSALHASLPLFRELAGYMPAIGKAISDFLGDMAAGGTGATEALRSLLNVVIGVIEVLGTLVRVLSQSYEQIIRFADNVATATDKMLGWIPLAGRVADAAKGMFDEIRYGTPHVTMMGRSLDATSGSVDLLTEAVHRAATAWDDYFGKTMSVDQTNDQLKRDMLGLKDAVAQNGRSLSDNTQKGLENRDMILGIIQDAQRARQAQIDMAGGANASADAVNRANAQYQATIDSLIQMGVRAGLSRKDLEALVGQYNINVIYTTTYKYRGTPPVNGSYSNIPTGRIGGMRQGGVISYAQGGISAAAGAGIYPDSLGPIVQFAEPGTGKEGYLPAQGISRSRAQGILAEEASWYGYGLTDRTAGGSRRAAGGGGSLSVNISVAPGASSRPLDQMMSSWFTSAVRNKAVQLLVNGQPVTVGSPR